MFATLTWWGLAIATPAILARRTLRRGKAALADRRHAQAEHWLDRAARHDNLQEVALCLMAESALLAQRPADALLALDNLLHGRPDDLSPRARLLRGLACTALREGTAAQHTLAPLADRPEASAEERLAMVQACLVAQDLSAARIYLNLIDPAHLRGPLLARLQLCLAALACHQSNYPAAQAALPNDRDCSPADRPVLARLRHQLTTQWPDGSLTR